MQLKETDRKLDKVAKMLGGMSENQGDVAEGAGFFETVQLTSDIAMGVISGFHGESYLLALQAILNRIEP